jgi:hypothetical protein
MYLWLNLLKERGCTVRHLWLMPVILATQEAAIRRIKAQSQHRVREILSQKYPTQKRAGGVAQGVGPECKPQYCKRKEGREGEREEGRERKRERERERERKKKEKERRKKEKERKKNKRALYNSTSPSYSTG